MVKCALEDTFEEWDVFEGLNIFSTEYYFSI